MAGFSIDVDILKDKKIMIGTPMYGGACSGQYAASIASVVSFCSLNNIQVELCYYYNESLITRARNKVVHTFLKSNCDYLFFIDSDISFSVVDFVCPIYLSEINSDIKIIAGLYPKKNINWSLIQKALDNGFINSEEEFLKYSGDYVVNFKNPTEFNLAEPTKVQYAGTGFMLISRNVFYTFIKKYENLYYLDDVTKEKMFAFFDCMIHPESKRYLSEDYSFCEYAKNAGIDIYVMPWTNLSHVGSYIYTGNFSESTLMENQVFKNKN